MTAVNTIITTKSGKVKGSARRTVISWKGIPYAKPPVGDLRFCHAHPHDGWGGILDAVRYGPACPQSRSSKNQSENCLTLNIWAPAQTESTGKKAVIFYIHGGSFRRGAGSESRYDGSRLAAGSDVIVVTFNYRLGVFGFLDFSAYGEQFQANCGLSDILLALQWTHENIAAFGGDPANITVIGQSAGANAVSLLVTLPEAKPCISKAIMMSGGPVWMHTQHHAHQIAARFLDFLGLVHAGQLLDMPADILVKKQRKFMKQEQTGEGAFSIVVDGETAPDFPIPAVAAGAAKNIPILLGNTKNELSFSTRGLLSKIMMVRDIALAVFLREKHNVRSNILNAYRQYGARAKSMLVSDQIFCLTSAWYAQAYSRHADTWTYRFNYEPALMKLTALGACHSSDIPYLFGNFGAASCAYMFLLSPVQSVIRRISTEIRHDFITFAKTGRCGWQPCSGAELPSKCYDHHTKVQPMIDPALQCEYEKTDFRRKSLSGSVIY